MERGCEGGAGAVRSPPALPGGFLTCGLQDPFAEASAPVCPSAAGLPSQLQTAEEPALLGKRSGSLPRQLGGREQLPATAWPRLGSANWARGAAIWSFGSGRGADAREGPWQLRTRRGKGRGLRVGAAWRVCGGSVCAAGMASGEEEQRPAPLKSPECRGSESRTPARESLLLPASHYLEKGGREPGGGNQNTPARAHTGCPSEVVFWFPFPPTSSIPLQETFLSKQHGCFDTSTLRQLLEPEHGVDKISPLGIDTLVSGGQRERKEWGEGSSALHV